MRDKTGETATLTKDRPTRRRFFQFGAVGLATSATIFGFPEQARADSCTPCCSLVYCPPNISATTCRNACHNYIWSYRKQYVGSAVTCTCCERYSSCSGGSINGSAADCRPT